MGSKQMASFQLPRWVQLEQMLFSVTHEAWFSSPIPPPEQISGAMMGRELLQNVGAGVFL